MNSSTVYKCNFYNHLHEKRSDSGVKATISDKCRSVCNEELGIAYFEAEVLTPTDYYPFGAVMPDRQWSAGAEGYRYGFNGKESDSETGFQDYGFRIYYPAIGKFLSVDPLSRAYPWNSGYAFAENRVIEGVDIDGLEYKTYHVLLKDGQAIEVISIEDHTKMQEEEIREVHKMSESKFYAKWSASWGPKGRGIFYIYYVQDDCGGIQRTTEESFEWTQNTFADRAGRHGLYSGAGCITKFGEKYGNLEYDFDQMPIDIPDQISKDHDMAYSLIELDEQAGYRGWYNETRLLAADKLLVLQIQKYLTDAKKPDFIDPLTNRPPSSEAIDRATRMLELFQTGAFWLKATGTAPDGPVVPHKEKLQEQQIKEESNEPKE